MECWLEDGVDVEEGFSTFHLLSLKGRTPGLQYPTKVKQAKGATAVDEFDMDYARTCMCVDDRETTFTVQFH